jgi:hypothetical protein
MRQGCFSPQDWGAGGAILRCIYLANWYKKQLNVYLCPTGETFSYPNDDTGIQQLTQRLQQAVPDLVVLETPGKLHFCIATAIMIPSFWGHSAELHTLIRQRPIDVTNSVRSSSTNTSSAPLETRQHVIGKELKRQQLSQLNN